MTTAVWDADVMITIDADLQDDPDKTPDSADFRLMSNRAVHAFEVLGTQFVLTRFGSTIGLSGREGILSANGTAGW